MKSRQKINTVSAYTHLRLLVSFICSNTWFGFRYVQNEVKLWAKDHHLSHMTRTIRKSPHGGKPEIHFAELTHLQFVSSGKYLIHQLPKVNLAYHIVNGTHVDCCVPLNASMYGCSRCHWWPWNDSMTVNKMYRPLEQATSAGLSLVDGSVNGVHRTETRRWAQEEGSWVRAYWCHSAEFLRWVDCMLIILPAFYCFCSIMIRNDVCDTGLRSEPSEYFVPALP